MKKGEYIERRGGKRAGAGRKKHNPIVTYNVHITAAHASLLKEWGGGNISAGLRWLVDAASILIHKIK